MTTAEAPVLYERDGGIVTITLNRPEKMNNFGGGLFPALGEAFERFRDDDSALVALLTGRGKAFCAGGDLEAMARSAGGETRPPPPTPDRQRQTFFQSRNATRITNIY